jgi:predicted alpha/beta hydrolase family esterase
MARAFLILHGVENRRPEGHWQRILAESLERRGERVVYPQLSNPDAPDYDDWVGELRGHLAALGDADERVAICHSMSCLLWLKCAGTGKGVVDRLLLVAPPDSAKLPPGGADFRVDLPPGFDGQAVRASVRAPIRIACSDADPYNPAGGGAMYAEAIGAEVDVLPGGGHVAIDDGYGPWAAVDEWCSDPSARLRPADHQSGGIAR